MSAIACGIAWLSGFLSMCLFQSNRDGWAWAVIIATVVVCTVLNGWDIVFALLQGLI